MSPHLHWKFHAQAGNVKNCVEENATAIEKPLKMVGVGRFELRQGKITKALKTQGNQWNQCVCGFSCRCIKMQRMPSYLCRSV
jgi:hypothetical protein